MNWHVLWEALPPEIVIVVRLLLALVLGAAVGWDREKLGKPAGLRTHMLVALGAATFMTLSLTSTTLSYGDDDLVNIDPTRVLQGVIGGVGFLGAGNIIKSNREDDVTGLTTAANLWVAGALGAACGMGAYLIALVGGTLALTVLRLISIGRS